MRCIKRASVSQSVKQQALFPMGKPKIRPLTESKPLI